MRGRLRYLLALAVLALCALVPGPGPTAGVPFLAVEQLRAWLAGPEAPLHPWVQGGRLPALAVDLRQSPPITDPALAAARRAEFARLGEAWAHANGVAIDPRAELPLAVVIGERGVRATLPRADGSLAMCERYFPSRLALLPPALAIALALVLRRVVVALLLACLTGSIAHAATGGAGWTATALWSGCRHLAVDTLGTRVLGDDMCRHVALAVALVFLTFGLVTANGSMPGLVAVVRRRVRGPVAAQLAAFAGGVLLCFDLHAHCAVLGPAVRPLGDAARVSRAKLAWIVDATAAPVAGLCLVSPWLVRAAAVTHAPLRVVAAAGGDEVFANTLPYRFYCLLALTFVVLTAVLRRDFGPMLAAERAARAGTAIADPPVAGARTPTAAIGAALPLLLLVAGMATAQLGSGVRGDVAFLGAAAAAFATALVATVAQRRLSPAAIAGTAGRALASLWPGLAILLLSWALGFVGEDLGTGLWLAAGARGVMVAPLLPLILFAAAGLVAFATGSGLGAMAILLPATVPLAHELGGAALMLALGGVLEGAICGEHCAPFSATTALSALGSRCEHLAHVATQLPYALSCAATALVCGYLPAALIGPAFWPASYALAVLVFVVTLRCCGKDPAADVTSSS